MADLRGKFGKHRSTAFRRVRRVRLGTQHAAPAPALAAAIEPARGVVSQGETRSTIEFSGSRTEGTFISTGSQPRADEEHEKRAGRWAVRGNDLVLTYEDGSQASLALTYYDIGKIGLERAPGQRTYYQKQTANVVPLHSRRA